MLSEIAAASTFLASHISADDSTKNRFRATLASHMARKFEYSWHPAHANRGNGYRAVGVFGGRADSLIQAAAEEAGVSRQEISTAYPHELVLWVDPFSVSFRAGEYGYPTTVWEDKVGAAAVARAAYGTQPPPYRPFSPSSSISSSSSPSSLPSPSQSPPPQISLTGADDAPLPQSQSDRRPVPQYRKPSMFPVLVS